MESPHVPEASTDQINGPQSQETCEEATDAQDGLKEALWLLLKDVILKTVEQSEMTPIESYYTIIDRLFPKLWDELKDEDFNIKKVPKLGKAILKDLHKIFCKPDTILLFLQVEHPQSANTFVSCFKKHLMTVSKKPSGVKRVFSSIGKTLKKAFCFC